MPLGICVSQAEMDLIELIWPEPEKGFPANRRGVIEFAPVLSRQIVDEIQMAVGMDDPVSIRLINRIVDIAGKSFLDGAANPVAYVPETDDIEEEDNDQIDMFDMDENE